MAVTSFKEIHNGRDGEEATDQRRTIRRYTRVFRVVTNSNSDDAAVIRAHASCPNVGDAHPNDVGSWCRRVNPRNESFSKTVWIVTAAYSSERELADSPLDDPAEIEWSTQAFTRPYFFDRDGYGIVNSAGDPYDPPADGDDSRWMAVVRKNVAVVPAWFLTYRDATNSDSFTLDGLTVAIGAAKIMEIRLSAEQERNGITYRAISISIAVDGNGWSLKLLDQGFRQLSGDYGETRINITDSRGERIDAPVPLNGSGYELEDPSPTNAVIREHHIYKSLPFSGLPLT